MVVVVLVLGVVLVVVVVVLVLGVVLVVVVVVLVLGVVVVVGAARDDEGEGEQRG